MSRLLKHLLAGATALTLAAAAWGAVEIADVQVTNVGTTTFTVVWTTSEVSTPALEVYGDSGGTNLLTPSLGLDFYPIAEGDPAVVNDSAARGGRRALEVLAVNRRVVVVRVSGATPDTTYYVRPRTFGPTGADNGGTPLALRSVKTALFTSMVVDGRVLRVRFPGLSVEGTVALVQGPAGTTPLSALVGDSSDADAAVVPLTGLLDTASGTNALFNSAQSITIRLLGVGAPAGSFTRTVNFAADFKVAQLEAVVSDLATPSPIFTQHPASRADQAGATATFTATATGTPAPTYKWQRQPAAGGAWSDLANDGTYSGVTTATLSVASVTLAMTGDQFRCVAMNGVPPDATSNAATLTVSLAQVAVAITNQPLPAVVAPGQGFSFTVAATGSPVPTFRWQRLPATGGGWGDLANGAPYAGVSTATLSVSAATLAMTGDQFRCVVANGVPSEAISNAVTVTVNRSVATVTLNNLSAVYDGTPKAVTATTVPDLPVVITYDGGSTAPTNAGSYAVVATVNDSTFSGTASGTLVIAKRDQTITFAALAPKLASDAPFPLGASASSALAVEYTSSNPAVASVAGSTVTLRSFGSTTLTASQPGNVNFNPAPAVTQLLVVNPVAPVITSTLSVRGVAGLAFSYAIQTNLTPATFSAGTLPAGLTLATGTGVISGTPTVPGTSNVIIGAQNISGSDSRTLAITIQEPPPLITSVLSASGQVGTAFSYVITASNSPTAFSATGLPSGLTVNSSSGAIGGTPTESGNFVATLTATNSGGSASQSLVLTISPAPSAPVYSGSLNPGGTQGQVFSFVPTFTGSPTTFALTSGVLPTGLTLNAGTGVISGSPSEVGVFPVTLRATNAGGPTDVALQITINPAPSAPLITSASSVSTTVGATFSFTLTATGVPSLFTFTATNRPAWLNLDTATGVLSGTPVQGTYNLQVYASNSPAAGVTQKGAESVLVITVNPSPNAPVITSSPVVIGRVGVPLSFQLTTQPAATAFAITSIDPPAWLVLNPSTGALTGTPTVAGPVRVVFAASVAPFGQGRGLEVLFDIAPPQLAPVITSGDTAQGQVGQQFRYALTAENGPITGFAMPTGTLPAGLSFNALLGVIEGIPSVSLNPTATEADGTTATVSLTATNAAGTSEPKVLRISILPPPRAPVIMSPLEATARVGDSFTYQIVASAGSPVGYMALNLPPGLTCNTSTGLISGTPTMAGSYLVAMRVSIPSLGVSGPYTLSLNVLPRLEAPRIVSLPAASGFVGAEFSYQIEAEPGPILSYQVAPPLPRGLTLNTATGLISGRPIEASLVMVHLTATNSAGTSMAQPFSLSITTAPGTPVITSSTGDIATVGVPHTYYITAANLPDVRPLAPPNSLGLAPNTESGEHHALPPGMAVNPAMGLIEGTPTATGMFTVRLAGTNAAGLGAARELRILVRPAVFAPVITSAPTAAGQVGVPFSHVLTATHNPTTFGVMDAPPWMIVNSLSGALSGTPPEPGIFVVRPLARNSAGFSDSATLTVNIAPDPATPIITSTRTATARLRTPFLYTITAVPAATSFVATGLPAGLSVDGATGVISGTPIASGNFMVTLKANNAAGESAPTVLSIKVLPSARLLPGR